MLADGVARAGAREALTATVDSAGVAAQRLDLVAAVTAAARLAGAEPLPAREVYVASDLQRSALADGMAAIPRGVRVVALAAPTDEAAPNRGIAAASAEEGAVAVSVGGTPGTPAAVVTVRLRGRDVGRALAAPGATLSLPLPPSPPGWWLGQVDLAADELRADDRRAFVWRVAQPARAVAGTDAGPFIAAGLAVLREGGRLAQGSDITIGERPGGGSVGSVVIPPADPALLGQANRALASRGVTWRYEASGTPGTLASQTLGMVSGVAVSRRYRLQATGEGESSAVLATANREPWLVRSGSVVLVGSRLDTAWTALPAAPAFIPFVDALLNRVARGEAAIVHAEGAPRVEFSVRGNDTVGAVVYGLDARESDLTPASPGAARLALGGTVELLAGARFAGAVFAARRRVDASGALLLLALLLAVAELSVATLTR